ncbi:acyl-CoA N-acyltransferase [Backusella circina FSU 941]|nr:acyl-CoA N-acyltransferase [Backusella circina FSU 941]
MTCAIIQATEEYVPVVTSLGTKTFVDTYGPDHPAEEVEAFLKKAYTHELQLKEINDPAMRTYIAYDGENPVGFCQLREKKNDFDFVGDSDAIELQRMYVDKDCSGKGFGSKLMEHAVQKSKKLGKKTMWVGVWELNPKAIQFYEKHGFRTVGSHIFKVGEQEDTDFIMIKDVSAS